MYRIVPVCRRVSYSCGSAGAGAVKCAVQSNAVQCIAVQCSAIQCNAVQCSAVTAEPEPVSKEQRGFRSSCKPHK